MTEFVFRVLEPVKPSYGLANFEIILNTDALELGCTVALLDDKNVTMMVCSDSVPTSKGWLYRMIFNGSDVTDSIKEGTPMVRLYGSRYSGDGGWGPPRPLEERLTLQQAVQLSIATLKNFEDEYSDVGPIIEKLQKAL